MVSFVPWTNGKFTFISGPVRSGKTTHIQIDLDAAVDSGLKTDGNIVVVKHPFDDPKENKIGRHDVTVTNKTEEIADKITNRTRSVIIAGASHYDNSIVDLVDALVRSNRDVIATGLNLDFEGRPYGTASRLMTIADDLILKKAFCAKDGCSSPASRSKKNGELYVPACTTHFNSWKRPGQDVSGSLVLECGSMRSGKSSASEIDFEETVQKGLDCVSFKWINDSRGDEGQTIEPFGECYVDLKDGKKRRSIAIRDGKDIAEYLTAHPEIRDIIIDEVEFVPDAYDTIFRLLPQGYRIRGTGLPRTFRRRDFGELPALMCLADTVNTHIAYCQVCYHPATDNQRLRFDSKKFVPAEYNEDTIAVDNKESKAVYKYEPRCIQHIAMPGEPPLKFSFPLYMKSV